MVDKNFAFNISIVIIILLFIIIFSNSNLFAPTGYVCAATCAFKDNFNDNAFDSVSWARTSSSTITEETQSIKGTATGTYQILQTVRTFTGRAEFGAIIKKSSGVDSGWAKVTITDSGVNFDSGQNGAQIYFDLDGKFGAHIKVGGQNTDYKFTDNSYAADTYYWIIIKRNSGGTLTFRIEDSNHGLISEKTTTQTISTSISIRFNPIEVAQNNAPTTGYVDEIYVDDYITPASTASSSTTSSTTTVPDTTSSSSTTTSLPDGSTSSSTTAPSGSSSSSTTTSPPTSLGSTSSSSPSTTTRTGGTTTTTRTGATTTTSGGTTTTTTIAELIDVSDQEAYNTIQEANKTIVELQSTKNISEALKLYGQAVDAYNTGDYANAKTFALQAPSSIT